jgi:hypothetical protein
MSNDMSSPSEIAAALERCSPDLPTISAAGYGGYEWFDRRSKAVAALCSNPELYVLKGPLDPQVSPLSGRDA